MPLIRAACPSFKERWKAYVSDPIYDEELLYVHLGEFASHIVELMVQGRVSEFEAVFDAVERLHVDGDLHVRRADGKTDPEGFVRYLEPQTARKWQLLNAAWKGDSEAARQLNT
jgi:hypothetical protein